MAGNTTASIQENQTFTTGVVPLVTGVLNPVNSPQSVWDCGVGMTYASITTVVTGSPASFTILLEGTYDGNTWTQIAFTTNTAGETKFASGAIPFTNLRARCTAVSGGSSPTVNVFVTASQQPFITSVSSTNPAQIVNQGVVSPAASLSGATTGVTGVPIDFNSARNSAMYQVVVTGTPTGGTITFLGSLDNTTFVPFTNASVYAGTAGTMTAGVLNASGTTNCLVIPGAAGNNQIAMRYFRADNTTLTGGSSPTVTVQVAAF